MPSSGDPSAELARTVGLCPRCRHVARQETTRGSVFWRCRLADTDSRFIRYPRLPVLACPGFSPHEGRPD